MANIAVDVDNTVVRSDLEWAKWCNTSSTLQINFEEAIAQGHSLPFCISDLWPDLRLSGLDFWREEDIYDRMEPMDGAVDVLHRLSLEHSIIFVSALKGNHHKSKFNFVKRHFPFALGFIGTKEKFLVNADILIDDRVKQLNQFLFFNQSRGAIKFDTPYTQDVEPAYNFTSINRWDWSTYHIIDYIAEGVERAKGY